MSQNSSNPDITDLSKAQDMVLSVLSLISGFVSVLSSSLIVYLVVRDKKKNSYKRLLLGLSLSDVFSSATLAVQVFLLPKATSNRVWASGTNETCHVLGFFTQMAFVTVWYNTILSFYYLITIRLGVKPKIFAKRIEPWMHISAVGYNLITASIGLGMGFYREMAIGHFCWVAKWPEGCVDNCKSNLIAWIYGGAPFIFAFVAIAANNLVIYLYVRRTIHRGGRASMRGDKHQQAKIDSVAAQAFLYVGTFYVSYTWLFILKVMESVNLTAAGESRVYVLLVLNAAFNPLQGFFNLCVYTRPLYIKYRQERPEEPIAWSLVRAWFGKDLPLVSNQPEGSSKFSYPSYTFRFGATKTASGGESNEFGKARMLIANDDLRSKENEIVSTEVDKNHIPTIPENCPNAMEESSNSFSNIQDTTICGDDFPAFVERNSAVDSDVKQTPVPALPLSVSKENPSDDGERSAE